MAHYTIPNRLSARGGKLYLYSIVQSIATITTSESYYYHACLLPLLVN